MTGTEKKTDDGKTSRLTFSNCPSRSNRQLIFAWNTQWRHKLELQPETSGSDRLGDFVGGAVDPKMRGRRLWHSRGQKFEYRRNEPERHIGPDEVKVAQPMFLLFSVTVTISQLLSSGASQTSQFSGCVLISPVPVSYTPAVVSSFLGASHQTTQPLYVLSLLPATGQPSRCIFFSR